MPKARVKKKTCKKCGADVREQTLFCYNCGNRVARAPAVAATLAKVESNGAVAGNDAETRAALEELAGRFKIDDDVGDGRLAKAAEERKKARVRPRQRVEFGWEQADDPGNWRLVLLAVLISVISAAAVFLTVLWK